MIRLLILCIVIFSNYSKAQVNLDSLYSKAKELRKLQKTDSAEMLLKEIVAAASESEAPQKITAKALNSLGILYFGIGDKEKALQSYYRSIEINRAINSKSGLLVNYNNLANYYLSDNKKNALEYYQKAIKLLADQKNVENKKAIINMNIGVLFSKTDFEYYNYDSAVYYFLNSLESFEAIEDSASLSMLYNNLGYLYEEKGNYEAATSNYKTSIELKRELGDKKGLAVSSMNLGNIYLKQEKYEESIIQYNESLALSKYVPDPNHNMHLYSNMVTAKMEIGAVKEASILFQKYNNLRDSLFDKEKMEEIKDLETKYETARKEEEIKAQQIAIERKNFQKNLFLGLSILLVLLILSTIWFFVQKQNYLKKLKNEEIANLKTEQELKELNAMMHGQEEERNRIASDLHDRLGARLSSIKLLFQSSDIPAAADKMMDNINQAIRETREISHNLSTDILSRFGMATALKDTIRTINDAERIRADLSIYGFENKLAADIERNIYHVLLELINNTIKHAKAETITLQLSKVENEISIFYEDDGIGFDVQNVNDSGMGMRSIYARINTINGAVYFNSKPGGGINVVISIPLPEDYQNASTDNSEAKQA